jgi:hypothetical protein
VRGVVRVAGSAQWRTRACEGERVSGRAGFAARPGREATAR